jgi:hypothetical protein
MNRYLKLVSFAAVLGAATVAYAAQSKPAGDHDDQFVITGCVMHTPKTPVAGRRSLYVWTKGDVFFDAPQTRFKFSEKAIGTMGSDALTFYWLDDENDFAKYVGQQVEVVGEMSDRAKDAEVEFTVKKDNTTEVEIKTGGNERKALVPTSWLGPATQGRDFKQHLSVRTIDVDKVTPLGACTKP